MKACSQILIKFNLFFIMISPVWVLFKNSLLPAHLKVMKNLLYIIFSKLDCFLLFQTQGHRLTDLLDGQRNHLEEAGLEKTELNVLYSWKWKMCCPVNKGCCSCLAISQYCGLAGEPWGTPVWRPMGGLLPSLQPLQTLPVVHPEGIQDGKEQDTGIG